MARRKESESLTMTVEEAGALLGLSRPLAYRQANLYLQTDGKEGLPCIRFGRRLLVPRAALMRMLSEGRSG